MALGRKWEFWRRFVGKDSKKKAYEYVNDKNKSDQYHKYKVVPIVKNEEYEVHIRDIGR